MYSYFAALLDKIPSGLISKLSLSQYPCSAKGLTGVNELQRNILMLPLPTTSSCLSDSTTTWPPSINTFAQKCKGRTNYSVNKRKRVYSLELGHH